MWFSVFIGLLLFLVLRFRRVWKESDLDPILWKWFVRLIWVGSIGFFQAVELQRYCEGLAYRPWFGLYAGVLFALAIWFLASLSANLSRRRMSIRANRELSNS
jgi:hypothetical protein